MYVIKYECAFQHVLYITAMLLTLPPGTPAFPVHQFLSQSSLLCQF